MRKVQSKKRLFIDELEVRRSSSPLIVQTMAIGEAGAVPKDRSGRTSQDSLVKSQKAHENMIKVKNDTGKSGMITTTAMGEEGKQVTTKAIGEEGTSPKPIKPGIVLKYAPGPKPPVIITTKAIGEEGTSSKPIKPGIVLKYAPGPKPPVIITTRAIGEEGTSSKPK